VTAAAAQVAAVTATAAQVAAATEVVTKVITEIVCMHGILSGSEAVPSIIIIVFSSLCPTE
jgi:hypothetical protein